MKNVLEKVEKHDLEGNIRFNLKKVSAKYVFLVVLLLLFSMMMALGFSEWLMRRLYPQFTLKQAQLVSPRVFKKSKLIPSTLLFNLDTQHIALTREFSSHYTTNSLGYRGAEFSVEKPDGVFRILMLGDSVTFGWGVENEETFSVLLEQKLRQELANKEVEVINAGWHDGYAPDSYYVYLINEGLKLEPDLIILNLFPWNDVSDLREMVWEKIDEKGMPTKISSTDRVVRRGYHVERVSSNWMFRLPVLRNSHLAILALTNLEQNSPETVNKIKKLLRVPEPQMVPQATVEECLYQQECTQELEGLFGRLEIVIQRINDLTQEAEAPMIVQILPAWSQTIPLAGEVNEQFPYLVKTNKPSALIVNSELVAQAQPQKRLKNFFGREAIEYFDPLVYFLNNQAGEYFYSKDGHPTKLGHQRLAEALFDYLTKTDYLLH